jgi:hypothetical protein
LESYTGLVAVLFRLEAIHLQVALSRVKGYQYLVDAAASRWWCGADLVAHVVPLSGAHTGHTGAKVIWFSYIGRNSSACKSIELVPLPFLLFFDLPSHT